MESFIRSHAHVELQVVGYGVLLSNSKRFPIPLAALSQTPKKKHLSSPDETFKKNPAPKLLRTWKEGRKILSGSVRPKLQQPTRTIDIGERQTEAFPDVSLELGTFSDQNEEEEERKHDVSNPFEINTMQRCLRDLGSANVLNCLHFNSCSGCTIDKGLEKPPVLKDAQRFFRCHGVPDLKLTTGSLWGWRCKAKLAVRGTSHNPIIGLYVEGTHETIDIPHCRTHHPRINEAVDLLKTGIRELGVEPYNEDTGSGELRYVQLTITTYNTSIPTKERYENGKVQVALVWNSRSEQSVTGPLLDSFSQYLWQKRGMKTMHPLIHSIWANFQTSTSNVIFGGRWRHLLGDQQCWERIGGVDVNLSPASFSQANLEAADASNTMQTIRQCLTHLSHYSSNAQMIAIVTVDCSFESLLRKLQKFIKPGKAVLELYAGSGTIGLSIAANTPCRSVRCVEVNKEAMMPFELSLSRLPSSCRSKITWHCADVSMSPLNWLKGSDVVVVDPPRKGLDASVINALRIASFKGKGEIVSEERRIKTEKRPWILRAQQAGVEAARESVSESLWPDTLIYVSCGWEAFKKDCTDLVEDGAWHLSAAEAFNFFPGTDSIEVLAVLKKGKRRDVKKALKKNGKPRLKQG